MPPAAPAAGDRGSLSDFAPDFLLHLAPFDMLDTLLEWLNLAVRWFHLVAGISWIGSSFYFMWLDSALEAPEPPKEGVEGGLWMVHSGGFYSVEKRLIRPGEVPKTLHWFKWEATLTAISGLFLLGIVYYAGGGSLLIDPAIMAITLPVAIGISLGTIVVTWLAYDMLWKFVGGRAPKVALVISLLGLAGLVYGMTHVFSGRAAFIHVGGVLGVMMVTNVWVRILPAQQAMIDATQAGRTPDYNLGIAAKQRSVHNSYVTLPVLFMMLSNHYPSTFGHAQNWLILGLLIVVGMGIRHGMIMQSKKQTALGVWGYAAAVMALAALIFLTLPKSTATASLAEGPRVTFAEANDVLVRRCRSCHSMTPTDDVFKVAPNGVSFDSPQTVQAMAARIRQRSFVDRTMPLINKTEITDAERETLARWIDQGAKID